VLQTIIYLHRLYYKCCFNTFSLTSFMGTCTKFSDNFVQYFCSNWVIWFLAADKQLAYNLHVPPLFFCIKGAQNIRPVVDLLHWNPHWWSPIILFMFWNNLGKIMLQNFFCVHDNSEKLSVLISVLETDTVRDPFHCCGNSSLFQMELMNWRI
jgi:hypothetical protein